jgi:hypothetical protein
MRPIPTSARIDRPGLGRFSYFFWMIPKGLLGAWITGNPQTTRSLISQSSCTAVHVDWVRPGLKHVILSFRAEWSNHSTMDRYRYCIGDIALTTSHWDDEVALTTCQGSIHSHLCNSRRCGGVVLTSGREVPGSNLAISLRLWAGLKRIWRYCCRWKLLASDGGKFFQSKFLLSEAILWKI